MRKIKLFLNLLLAIGFTLALVIAWDTLGEYVFTLNILPQVPIGARLFFGIGAAVFAINAALLLKQERGLAV
jgi:hypothetical protein